MRNWLIGLLTKKVVYVTKFKKVVIPEGMKVRSVSLSVGDISAMLFIHHGSECELVEFCNVEDAMSDFNNVVKLINRSA